MSRGQRSRRGTSRTSLCRRSFTVSVTPERVTVMLQIADVLGAMIKAQSAGQAVRVRAADAALVARLIPLERTGDG